MILGRLHYTYRNHGFALPTVIITSVVMMIVLLVSLQSISSITAGINSQFEQKIMNETMESGVAYASACISALPSTPTWSDSKPLTNSTDCNGDSLPSSQACSNASTSGDCGVSNTTGNATSKYQTTFSATISTIGNVSTVTVRGATNFMRTSDNTTIRTTTDLRKLDLAQIRNADNDRAVQRYWQLGATTYGTTAYTGISRLDFGKTGSTSPSIASNTVTAVTSPSDGAQYREGITVVTDKDGNYQFSTNGIDAWNINNTKFTNSNSNLGASDSTSQGVIAFPIGKTNKYVIIGNSAGNDDPGDDNPGAYGKLTRTIVTMNGTTGSISDPKTYELSDLNNLKTDQIATEPNGTPYYTGQFMSAAPESSGKGYWVVFGTPGVANFYAILFNNNGNPTKVKRSDVPGGQIPVCQAKIKNNNTYYWRAGFGTLHFNNAYTKFALKAGAYTGYGTASDCRSNGVAPANYSRDSYNQGRDYLMSFDASTGAMASGSYWDGTTISQCLDTRYANAGYSIDFSPNEDYLYETNIYPGRIFRYRITGSDIDSGSTKIGSTIRLIATSDTYSQTNANNALSSGQVRRAPDGRMYVALQYSNAISYIVNPDAAEDVSGGTSVAKACTNTVGDSNNATNFKYGAFGLGGNVKSSLGLPDYVTRYVPRQLQY